MVNCCVCSYSCGRLAVESAAGFSSQSYLNIVKQYCFFVFFYSIFSNLLIWRTLFADICFVFVSFFVVLKCNLFIGFCLHNDILCFCALLSNFLCVFGKNVVFFFLF